MLLFEVRKVRFTRAANSFHSKLTHQSSTLTCFPPLNYTDELSKGRFDGALTRNCIGFMLEVFDRTIGRDLGPKLGKDEKPEHIC